MRPLCLLPAPAPVPESLHWHHQPDPKTQIHELVRRMAASKWPQHRRPGNGATGNTEGMYSIKNIRCNDEEEELLRTRTEDSALLSDPIKMIHWRFQKGPFSRKDNCNSRFSMIFLNRFWRILENSGFYSILESSGELFVLEWKLNTSRALHFLKQKTFRVLESSTKYNGGFFSGELQRELYSPCFGEFHSLKHMNLQFPENFSLDISVFTF